jgi:acyl-CoA synthetase (AMP-forming)/AMP-acid ligase II
VAGLRDFLLTRLAMYKIKVYVDIVTELPRTGSGKSTRRYCAPAVGGTATSVQFAMTAVLRASMVKPEQ